MGQLNLLGILAGTDISLEVLVAWARSADIVVAADGAANRLIEAGVWPDIVVGDLDSLDPSVERSNLDLKEDQDQETTDCDKLLKLVKESYPDASFSLAGLEGDRFDHVLASLHSVARLYPQTRLVLRDGFGWFVLPGEEKVIRTKEGQTVSMIPILPCEGVRMEGVVWPPNPNLSPLGYTSISNMANGNEVRTSFQAGLALLILQAYSLEPSWK